MSKDKGLQNEREQLSNEDTRNLLATTVAQAAIAQLSRVEKNLKESAAKTEGNLQPSEGKAVKDILPVSLGSAVGLAISGLEASKEGPILDAKALEDFKKGIEKSFEKLYANAPDFSGGEKEITEQIATLKREVVKLKDELKSTGVKPEIKPVKLSEQETKQLLTKKVTELIDHEIKETEKILNHNAQKHGGEVNPKSAGALKSTFDEKIREARSNAIASLEAQQKDGPILDAKALETFKKSSEELTDKALKNVKFEGRPASIMQQLEGLKRDVSNSNNAHASEEVKSVQAHIIHEKSVEAPEKASSSPTHEHHQTIKLPSKETWNLLASKALEHVNKTIDKAVNFHNEIAAVEGTELIPKDPADIFRDSKEELRIVLQKAFKEEIALQVKQNKGVNTHLDHKTVELLKQNSDKLVDHILDNSKVFSDKNLNIDSAKLHLKHEVSNFSREIEIHSDRSGWKKAADFCKSIKIDRLADFCSQKHMESLAKQISKNLNKDHSKSHKVNLDASKPKSPKHKANTNLGI